LTNQVSQPQQTVYQHNLAGRGDINTRIGSLSLLENVEEVEALLKKIHAKDGIYYMLSWPILDFVRDKVQDLELKNLLTTSPIRKQGVRAS
jgi:hypothetical protein